MRFLLQAAKAAFTEVDVSLSVVDKEYLHKHSGHEKKITLPQVFLDGEYLGVEHTQQLHHTDAACTPTVQPWPTPTHPLPVPDCVLLAEQG